MLASVMVTFEESTERHVREVLGELRKTNFANIQSITIGQYFGKKSASILLPEDGLEKIFEKLVANDINIYPFNEDYKSKIQQTMLNVRGSSSYMKDKLRTIQNKMEERKHFSSSNYFGLQPTQRVDEFIPDETYSSTNSSAKSNSISSCEISDPSPKSKSFDASITAIVTNGDYVGLRNLIKKYPMQNHSLREKLIPTIKNCIQINYEKGMSEKSYVCTAIKNLKEIICDSEIKSITKEDLINAAGNALLILSTLGENDELISIINLPNIGHKINVMAAIRLAEMIFENKPAGGIDFNLLEYVHNKLNLRHLLNAYDVMYPVISDVNKNRFNMLIGAIENLKNNKN